MTISHFASDDLLLRYAAGRLSAAPSLVMACHLSMSEESRGRLDVLESLGGALLEEQPLATIAPDLFDRTLARLQDAAPTVALPRYDHQRLGMGVDLPEPLRRCAIDRWRWMGPGMHFARIEMPEDPAVNLVLLRIGAGRTMPEHGHSGQELTLVLKGSFHDESGRYGVGDIAEEDDDTDHQPVVDDSGECICLASINGPMRPHGWIARMIQPLIGL